MLRTTRLAAALLVLSFGSVVASSAGAIPGSPAGSGASPAEESARRTLDLRQCVLRCVRPDTRAAAAARPAHSEPPAGVLGWGEPCGFPVTSEFGGQFGPALASDGSGGAFVFWSDGRAFDHTEIYANRFGADGNLASGWTSAGLAISSTTGSQVGAAAVSDGSHGAIVAWGEFPDLFNSDVQGIFVQRITTTGAVAAGWSSTPLHLGVGKIGLPIVNRTDGLGGCVIGFSDSVGQFRLLHVTSAGALAAGWPASGLPVGLANYYGDFVGDGTGGVCAVNYSGADSVMGFRYLADGSLAPGWSATGNLVDSGGSFTIFPTVTRLSGGDLLFVFNDYRSFIRTDLFAQRFTPAGVPASGWPVNGIQVSPGAENPGGLKVAPDGSNGAVIVWYDTRNGGSFRATRITGAGALSPGWQADGVPLCNAPAPKPVPLWMADGTGGGIVAWTDNRNGTDYGVFATRVQSNGVVPAGFPAGGATICDATQYQTDVVFDTDGAGGAILAWADLRNAATLGEQVFVTRLFGDGTVEANAALVSASAEPGLVRLHWFSPDAGFHATVERDAAGAGWTSLADVRADGTGHVRFEDRDVTPGATYRYRLSLDDAGQRRVLGEVTIQIPSGLAFGLEGSRPNPAEAPFDVAFTLPVAGPARLDLIDVAGRRVLSRDLSEFGAGRHVVRLEETNALGAGVYMLRLTQGGRMRTSKAVVAR